MIQYEYLIKNSEKEFKNLLQKLNILDDNSKEAKNGDLFDRIPDKQKPMHFNIVMTPQKYRIDNWKKDLNSVHIYIFEEIAGANLLKLGYKTIQPKINSKQIYLIELNYRLKYIFKKSFQKLKSSFLK